MPNRKPNLYFEDTECRTCPAYPFDWKLKEWRSEKVDVSQIETGAHVIRDGIEMVKVESGELRNLLKNEPELWDGVSVPDEAQIEELSPSRFSEDESQVEPIHAIKYS